MRITELFFQAFDSASMILCQGLNMLACALLARAFGIALHWHWHALRVIGTLTKVAEYVQHHNDDERIYYICIYQYSVGNGPSIKAHCDTLASADELQEIGSQTELLVLPEDPDRVRVPQCIFPGFLMGAAMFCFLVFYSLNVTWSDDGPTTLTWIVGCLASVATVTGFVRGLKS